MIQLIEAFNINTPNTTIKYLVDDEIPLTIGIPYIFKMEQYLPFGDYGFVPSYSGGGSIDVIRIPVIIEFNETT